MNITDERLRRIGADMPDPTNPDFEMALIQRAQRARAGAHHRPTSSTRRRVRTSMRLRVVAGGAALLAAAGIAYAALTFPQAPPEVREPIQSALTLPSPEFERLKPVPGGIHQVLAGENDAGDWYLYTIETQDKGTFLTYGLAAPAATSVAPGWAIGGCAAPEDPVIAPPCMGGDGPYLPGTAPAGPITSAGQSAYTMAAGRASAEVHAVELVRADGSTVRGWAANGYYLVIDLQAGPISGQIRALDATGATIASTDAAAHRSG